MAHTGTSSMTKLEAWKAWSAKAGSAYLASEFTLERSSHGKAFSFAWDAAMEAAAQVCDQRATEDKWEGCYANACAEAIRARGNL